MVPAWWLRSATGRWPAILLAPPVLAIGLYLGGVLGLELGRIVPALVLATAVCWSYSRHAAFRRYLSWLAIAVLVAPLHLLLDPAVRRVTMRGASGATGGAAGWRPPVVMLLLDELPLATLLDSNGMLDRRRFPNLASLADQAHWFTDLRSVDTATERAVPALLTGRLPAEGAQPVVADQPVNLFTLLAPHYRIAASESVSRLCPPELNGLAKDDRILGGGSWLIDVAVVTLHLWMPQPLAGRILPPVERAWQLFPTAAAPRTGKKHWRRWRGAAPARRRDRVSKFRGLLDAIDERRTGVLYFTHLMLPHRPWIYLAHGEGYLADGFREMKDFGSDRWPTAPTAANRAYQRHLLQAEFTDRLVGELLDLLRTRDLFERSLIVVTADHGISFRPGERVRKLSETNTEDLLRVPLLLKEPGQTTGLVHHETRSVLALLPTVLTLLELEIPATLADDRLTEPSATTSPFTPPVGLEHRRSVFGDLEAPADLYAFGPYASWIGFHRTEDDPPRHPDIEVSLLGQGSTLRREEGAQPVPAWVFGNVDADADLGDYGIAVSVDGTVAATGEIERLEGLNRFNVLLPPWSIPPGEHRLEILLLEPAGATAWSLPAH